MKGPEDVWVVLEEYGTRGGDYLAASVWPDEETAEGERGQEEHVQHYIHADRHAAELATAREERLKALAKATRYECDWYAAKSEFGTAMALAHQERDAARADLTAARQRILELQVKAQKLTDWLDDAAPLRCNTCGPNIKIDEDGCCAMCGEDAGCP